MEWGGAIFRCNIHVDPELAQTRNNFLVLLQHRMMQRRKPILFFAVRDVFLPKKSNLVTLFLRIFTMSQQNF